MKRHHHRKVRIKAGDLVRTTTEIAFPDMPSIPLGKTGTVTLTRGGLLAVAFEGGPNSWVSRGQVRLEAPTIRMVDGKPVWARDVAKGETIAVTPEQCAAAEVRS